MHLAIPVGVSVLLSVLPRQALGSRALQLLVLTALLSFLVQGAFLLTLQASACNGVKTYGTVFVGAGVAALITAAMAAIPIYVEPMRLAVSQLFGRHYTLLTPAMKAANAAIAEAAQKIAGAAGGVQEAIGGGGLDATQYEDQIFREMMIGAAYWAAFAGAYGVGVGSIMVTGCPAAS